MEQRDIRRAQLRVNGARSRKRSPHRDEADQISETTKNDASRDGNEAEAPEGSAVCQSTVHDPQGSVCGQAVPTQRWIRSFANGQWRISHQRPHSCSDKRASRSALLRAPAAVGGGAGLGCTGMGRERISHDRIVVAPRMACRSLGCIATDGVGLQRTEPPVAVLAQRWAGGEEGEARRRCSCMREMWMASAGRRDGEEVAKMPIPARKCVAPPSSSASALWGEARIASFRFYKCKAARQMLAMRPSSPAVTNSGPRTGPGAPPLLPPLPSSVGTAPVQTTRRR